MPKGQHEEEHEGARLAGLGLPGDLADDEQHEEDEGTDTPGREEIRDLFFVEPEYGAFHRLALLLGCSLGNGSGLLATGWPPHLRLGEPPSLLPWQPALQPLPFSRRSLPGSSWLGRLACTQVGGDAHAQGVQLDEAARVALVVGTGIVLEGGDGRVEQRIGLRVAADDDHVALVQLQANRTVRRSAGCGRSDTCSALRSGLHQ